MPYAYMGDNCYGRADYYRGDYYRGDPGLLGSVGRALLGGVKGALGGGITGAISGAIQGYIGKGKGTALAPVPTPLQGGEVFVGAKGPFGIQVGYERTVGASAGATVQVPTVGPDGRVCMVPMKLNKSTYVTRGGGTSRWPRELIVHPKGTECVSPRRMNVANPYALRRAIRRGRGFIKLSRKAAGAFGFSVVSRAAAARKKGGKR